MVYLGSTVLGHTAGVEVDSKVVLYGRDDGGEVTPVQSAAAKSRTEEYEAV